MGLEKCLRRIGAHPILSKSPEFKMFLEAIDLEAEIKKKEPKKGLFSALTDTIQQATQSFNKIPEPDEVSLPFFSCLLLKNKNKLISFYSLVV